MSIYMCYIYHYLLVCSIRVVEVIGGCYRWFVYGGGRGRKVVGVSGCTVLY